MKKVTSAATLMARVALCLFALFVLVPYGANAQDRLELSNPTVNDQPNVAVTLSLTDEHGLPVTDLSSSEVRVTENGVSQPDVEVYPYYEQATPINVVLALDTSRSMRGKPFRDARQAAHNFVDNLALNDKVGVVSFGTEAKLVTPLTGDADAASHAIDSLKLSPNTALNDALVVASREASRGPSPHLVVLMTDGANWKSTLSQSEALEQVNALHVPVYTIAFGKHANTQALETIAQSTGGKYYEASNGNALKDLFGNISQQLHQGYQLSYTSTTRASPGSPVTVRVEVRRDGVVSSATFTYAYAARAQTDLPASPIHTGNLPLVNPGRSAEPMHATPLTRFGPPILAALGVLALCGGLFLAGTPSRVQRRLAMFVSPFSYGPRRQTRTSFVGDLVRPLTRLVSGVVLRVLPAGQQRRMMDALASAGHPRGMRLPQFVALKTAIGLLAGVLGALLTHHALLGPLWFAVGFYLPDIWLSQRVKQRRKKVLLQLPDALDLLTISVEAGLGFDAAMQEVVHKWDNEIAQEFATALGEMKLGKSRRDALRGMSKRVSVQEMQLFVSAIVQADEVGMSIGRTLHNQAEQMRLRRRQRAEELAHKAVIKIIIPMVFFIFPSLFVVLLGPAIPVFMSAFKAMGH